MLHIKFSFTLTDLWLCFKNKFGDAAGQDSRSEFIQGQNLEKNTNLCDIIDLY